MSFRPTIIVFTREPVPGASKTRLAVRIGSRNAAALADAFTHDALAKVRKLGSPMVIAASATGALHDNHYFRTLARRFDAVLVDQEHGHLGARMARVLSAYAPAGALLIGTDTPSLPGSILRRAAALIRRNHVVLGPSLDGGYYLVGIRGAVPDIFRGIRWGGSRVLQQTLTRLAKLEIQPALAPAWYDVDRWGDLMVLAQQLSRLGQHRVMPCPQTAKVLAQLGLLRTCR
jgi:rSAM/selenodomain-associated transferase 1